MRYLVRGCSGVFLSIWILAWLCDHVNTTKPVRSRDEQTGLDEEERATALERVHEGDRELWQRCTAGQSRALHRWCAGEDEPLLAPARWADDHLFPCHVDAEALEDLHAEVCLQELARDDLTIAGHGGDVARSQWVSFRGDVHLPSWLPDQRSDPDELIGAPGQLDPVAVLIGDRQSGRHRERTVLGPVDEVEPVADRQFHGDVGECDEDGGGSHVAP